MTVAKRAANDANFVSRQEPWPTIKSNKAFGIFSALYRIDNRLCDRNGPVAVADKPGDTDSGIDRKPTLLGHIDRDEEVSGEKRRRDLFDAPGMPTLLQIPGQIDAEILAPQMLRCFGLGMRASLCNIPV